MSASQLLYDHAKEDLGLAEVSGPKSNPRIAQAIERAAKWLDRDDGKTAWCGCMMGQWCFELGLAVPAEYYRAKNWLNWGVAVAPADAKLGDVVVISRTGGNHVALLNRIDGKRWWLLGGNQGDRVCLAAYSGALVLGVRRAA